MTLEINIPALNDNRALCTEGGFGTGFWKWSLDVDLEALKDGKGAEAISVEQNHDTAGMSFRQYHGIVKSYPLPAGVKTEALKPVIAGIVERAEELTAGFSTRWDGDWKAVWENSEGADDAVYYWDEQLAYTLQDLDCVQTYDLSDSDNRSYVLDNLRQVAAEEWAGITALSKDEMVERLEALLNESYQDDEDYSYIGFTQAAEEFADYIIENREDDEE